MSLQFVVDGANQTDRRSGSPTTGRSFFLYGGCAAHVNAIYTQFSVKENMPLCRLLQSCTA